jgi:hypothetical protein
VWPENLESAIGRAEVVPAACRLPIDEPAFPRPKGRAIDPRESSLLGFVRDVLF